MAILCGYLVKVFSKPLFDQLSAHLVNFATEPLNVVRLELNFTVARMTERNQMTYRVACHRRLVVLPVMNALSSTPTALTLVRLTTQDQFSNAPPELRPQIRLVTVEPE